LASHANILTQPQFPAAAHSTSPAWRTVDRLAPLLLLPLVVFQLGYIYQGPNDALLEPWILRLSDPTRLTRDWFANTIPHHPNFVHFLSWTSSWIPLPAAMLAIQLLALFSMLWVAQRISVRLFGDRRVFYVALFLFLRWGTEALGGNSLWSDYPVPHNAALPLCLLAFYLSLLDKPLGAALAAAAATWIHIQLGALTILVVGAEWLVCWIAGELSRHPPSKPALAAQPSTSPGMGQIAIAAAVYAITVAPTLLRQWALYVTAPSPLSAPQFLALHAVLRQPHHLIPSSWPTSDFYRFFLILGIGLIGLSWRKPAHRQVVAWCAIILALCALGTIFVEWAPVKLIIKMQLFRLTVFIKFFAILGVANFLLRAIDQENWAEKLCALAILAIQNFLVIGACAAMILFLRRSRRLAVALASLGGSAIAAALLLSMHSSARHGLALPLAIAPRGIVIGLLSLSLLAAVVRLQARLLPGALLALALVLRVSTGLPYFTYNHPPLDDWYRFCRQVRAATPTDAIFITPPVMGGFQMFAERAEVADFKSTPSIERDLIEWHERMSNLAGVRDLHCSGWPECSFALSDGYSRLNEQDFLSLARKYGAQYVVSSGPGRRLLFPEVLRVGDFGLYRVSQ